MRRFPGILINEPSHVLRSFQTRDLVVCDWGSRMQVQGCGGPSISTTVVSILHPIPPSFRVSPVGMIGKTRQQIRVQGCNKMIFLSFILFILNPSFRIRNG